MVAKGCEGDWEYKTPKVAPARPFLTVLCTSNCTCPPVAGAGEADGEEDGGRGLDGGVHGPQGQHDALHAQVTRPPRQPIPITGILSLCFLATF